MCFPPRVLARDATDAWGKSRGIPMEVRCCLFHRNKSNSLVLKIKLFSYAILVYVHDTYDGGLQCGVFGLMFHMGVLWATVSINTSWQQTETVSVTLKAGKTMFLCRSQDTISKLRVIFLYQYNISVDH